MENTARKSITNAGQVAENGYELAKMVLERRYDPQFAHDMEQVARAIVAAVEGGA